MYYVLILYRNKQRYWADFETYEEAMEFLNTKFHEPHIAQVRLVTE